MHLSFDPSTVPSPCFITDLGLIRKNLSILDRVQKEAGAKILLALKGFAQWTVFPELNNTLHGTCASGVWEAKLGRELFGKEVEVFSPAFTDDDIQEVTEIADHVIFNSFNQLEKYRDVILSAKRKIDIGLRVNPEHSEGATALYNPCSPFSRLGITRSQFDGKPIPGVTGLHFHTLCQQNADALERTLEVVESKWGYLFPQLKWINFGGGHHITRSDYDVERLIRSIKRIREAYQLDVYLEPGEAVALNAGFLVCTVLDIIENRMPIAILDTSASCHMPDVLEMPYRPEIIGGSMPKEKPFTYRLGGGTCLAGDVIGDYSFDRPLKTGDKLVFTDMAIYSMVKTTFFNGIRHPDIATYDPSTGKLDISRRFTWEDFKNRLA